MNKSLLIDLCSGQESALQGRKGNTIIGNRRYYQEMGGQNPQIWWREDKRLMYYVFIHECVMHTLVYK